MSRLFLVLFAAVLFNACGESERKYTWAFAQEMDGSFLENENCRESLAQSLYVPENEPKTFREATTNVFVFQGNIQTYKIYGFNSQQECETALTNMVMRRRITQP